MLALAADGCHWSQNSQLARTCKAGPGGNVLTRSLHHHGCNGHDVLRAGCLAVVGPQIPVQVLHTVRALGYLRFPLHCYDMTCCLAVVGPQVAVQVLHAFTVVSWGWLLNRRCGGRQTAVRVLCGPQVSVQVLRGEMGAFALGFMSSGGHGAVWSRSTMLAQPEVEMDHRHWSIIASADRALNTCQIYSRPLSCTLQSVGSHASPSQAT